MLAVFPLLDIKKSRWNVWKQHVNCKYIIMLRRYFASAIFLKHDPNWAQQVAYFQAIAKYVIN